MNEHARGLFGRKVREARIRAGLNQRELAKLIGTPQGKISKIENGKTDAQLSTIRKLARALGVSSTDLLPPD